MTLLLLWARAFAITLTLEALIAIPLLRRQASWSRVATAVVFAQVLTHPAVWFIFPLFEWPRALYLLVAEGWALLGEVAFYRLVFPSLGYGRALAVSALANGASYAAGLLLK
ncbi:MAG: hypothetical protein QM756_04890 [Polyangiaceae bacterium]